MLFRSPEALQEWHQNTGYVPVSRSAESMLRKSGYFSQHPLAEIVNRQWQPRAAGNFARGVRLRRFAEIRGIVDEELEAVWNNVKPPKAALDDAVERGNALLKKLTAMAPPPARAAVATPAGMARPAGPRPCSGCR